MTAIGYTSFVASAHEKRANVVVMLAARNLTPSSFTWIWQSSRRRRQGSERARCNEETDSS